MENSLLVGLSRQVVLERELDVVANNLANLNTTAFKSDVPMFEEYLMPTARANNFRPADSRLSFVREHGTMLDFSQGAIQQTGNPLDVAIRGDGFLVVQTPQGERYTRDGSLQINAAGELVTSQGYQVVGDNGPIVFQAQDNNIAISADGIVSVRSGSVTNLSIIRGKLRVATFPQQQRLLKEGGNLFAAPDDMAATDATRPHLVQGAIEKSNVEGITEVTRMINVSRSYTMIANMLKDQGDMLKTAIQQLASVPSS
jgi:flagellar basal-body rod protein FlgF